MNRKWKYLAAIGGTLALAAGLPAAGAAQAARRPPPARPAQAVSRPGSPAPGGVFPSGVKGLPAAGARPVPLAGAAQGFLYGADFLSPARGWAVGFSCAPNCARGPEDTLIERWNGSTWTRVPSPDLSPIEGLTSVSAVSATDAWAAGTYYAPRSLQVFRTLLLHWNGTRWSRVASPDPSPDASSGLNILAGVTATSARNAWAAGYSCAGHCGPGFPPGRALILHWNGIKWSRAASPSPLTSTLTGVTSVSAANAWTVGYFCVQHCAQGDDRTLILHWDGTRWSRATSPDPGHGGSVLAGIGAASPARAWAVGFTCAQACENTSVFHPLVLRWNGTRWSPG
jgi:hypothetical protein